MSIREFKQALANREYQVNLPVNLVDLDNSEHADEVDLAASNRKLLRDVAQKEQLDMYKAVAADYGVSVDSVIRVAGYVMTLVEDMPLAHNDVWILDDLVDAMEMIKDFNEENEDEQYFDS